MKICPQCSAENRDSANFCNVCRASLQGVPPVNPQAVPPPPPHGGTYRGLPAQGLPQQPGQQGYHANPPVPQGQQQIQQPYYPNQASYNPLVAQYPAGVSSQGQQIAGPYAPGPYPAAIAAQPKPWYRRLLPVPIFNRVVQPGKSGWSFWHGRIKAEGRVSAADPVREMPMPFDPGQTLFVLSLVLIGLGALIFIATIALAVAIALLILGVGGLCLGPIVLPMLGALLYPLYSLFRGKRKAPMTEFRVEDEWTGQPVSVLMYLGQGASSIRMGDRVRVYGSRSLLNKTLRAHHIDVIETNQQSVHYGIDGIRPWSIWIGLVAVALVVAGYWWLFTNGTFGF